MQQTPPPPRPFLGVVLYHPASILFLLCVWNLAHGGRGLLVPEGGGPYVVLGLCRTLLFVASRAPSPACCCTQWCRLCRVQNGFPAVDFGGVRLVSTTRLAPGQWHHLAATKFKQARKLASTVLYVDGVATTLTVSCKRTCGRTYEGVVCGLLCYCCCCWLLLVVVGCCWLLLVVVGCWLLLLLLFVVVVFIRKSDTSKHALFVPLPRCIVSPPWCFRSSCCCLNPMLCDAPRWTITGHCPTWTAVPWCSAHPTPCLWVRAWCSTLTLPRGPRPSWGSSVRACSPSSPLLLHTLYFASCCDHIVHACSWCQCATISVAKLCVVAAFYATCVLSSHVHTHMSAS
jgi:hypothetical protein